MVQVSEKAQKEIRRLIDQESGSLEDTYIKIGVKTGGCSGFSYDLKFTKEIDEDDEVLEENNIKILVERKYVMYLSGTILEFSDGLNGKGFVFNNPNAVTTCKCGESFSV